MRAAYFLLGTLPPLLIFPLHRRTLIVWPLVYVAGVRFCRELVEAAKECRGKTWMGHVAALTVAAALFFTTLGGLRSYAVGNPATLVYPYFGPPDQHLMIDEAKHLVRDYDLLFPSPGILKHMITIGLYEPARMTGRQHAFELLTGGDNDDLNASIMRGGRKKCFVFFNDEAHADLPERLQRDFPGGKLVERLGGSPNQSPLYWLYFFPSE